MTLPEAIHDPKRPLSVSPFDWMNRATESLDSKPAELTAKKKQEAPIAIAEPDEQALSDLDTGIDSIVSGIQMVYEALKQANLADVKPDARKVFDGVKDLMDTAVAPYMADVIKLMDGLEAPPEAK